MASYLHLYWGEETGYLESWLNAQVPNRQGPLTPKNNLVQVFIPEFSFGVVLPQQLLEVGHPLIQGKQALMRDRKKLTPVRPGMERGQLRFDHRQNFADCRPVRLPGKMKSRTGLLIAGAHPKIIRSYTADLGDQ